MPTAEPRDEDRLGRLCYIIEAALEYFISIMVTGAYLARVTAALGFSDSLTGILSSFVSMGCVFQLGAIGLFRNTDRVKRPTVLLHLVNQALFACVYFIPVAPLSAEARTALFLICFCGGFVISNLIMPAKTGWLRSLVPDGLRGVFTARMEIVSLLGGMAFSYLTGFAIDAMEAAGNQRGTFVFGGVVIVALMLLHALSLLPAREAPSAQSKRAGSLKELWENKRFRGIVPVIVLWNVANCASTPFFGAYQIKELGFSMTFISVLSIGYSLVRAAASPVMGRYADRRSFSRMVTLCFFVAAASFLVNCFTVPENGKVLYTLHYCLLALAMAGINSALINLVYDCVQGSARRNALAVTSALGGLFGFGATCLMSPVVAYIQGCGNRLLGLKMYPAQFVSAAAFCILAALIAYLRLRVIPGEKG